MSYKFKNKVLVIGFLVSLFIVYQLAIKKTIETKRTVISLKEDKKLLDNAAVKISELKQQEKYLDSVLKNYDISVNNSFQQTLLQKITTFSKSKKVEIIAFEQPHQYHETGTKLFTYSFEIKGDFISLLQMIYELEQQQLGKLISVNFTKKKKYPINRTYLTCTILLQKIENL